MKILDKLIDARITRQIERILDGIVELDPKKSYILILPEEIPETDLSAFSGIETNINLLVIRSDHVKLIELSKGTDND